MGTLPGAFSQAKMMVSQKFFLFVTFIWLVIGQCCAFGEEIGKDIGGDGGGDASSDSIEDPHIFIPAEPLDLMRGWCCGSGPYNVTTVEHYLKNRTVDVAITKAAVVNRVMPCPSKLYPNRKTEADCYNYEQRYYTITKQVSQKHHGKVTREFACKDDVYVCCPDHIFIQGIYCFSQEECEQHNRLQRMMGLPEED